jgi:hypothetical protein
VLVILSDALGFMLGKVPREPIFFSLLNCVVWVNDVDLPSFIFVQRDARGVFKDTILDLHIQLGHQFFTDARMA